MEQDFFISGTPVTLPFSFIGRKRWCVTRGAYRWGGSFCFIPLERICKRCEGGYRNDTFPCRQASLISFASCLYPCEHVGFGEDLARSTRGDPKFDTQPGGAGSLTTRARGTCQVSIGLNRTGGLWPELDASWLRLGARFRNPVVEVTKGFWYGLYLTLSLFSLQ